MAEMETAQPETAEVLTTEPLPGCDLTWDKLNTDLKPEAAQAETLEALVEEVKSAMQELTPEARQMALAFVQGLQIGQELARKVGA